MLGFSFRLRQRCYHTTTWLKEVHSSLLAFLDFRDALMLITPNNEVEKARDLAFTDRVAPVRPIHHTFEFVLVHHKNIKPLVFVLARPFELEGFLFESDVESHIIDMAKSVQSYLGLPFDEEHWLHFDLFQILDFPYVVDVVVG